MAPHYVVNAGAGVRERSRVRRCRHHREVGGGPVSQSHRHGERSSACSGRGDRYASVTFGDLSKVAWAQDAIEGLAARSAVNGIGNGKFNPTGKVTRAEFITMLMNAFDLTDATATSTLRDVKAGAWYYGAIATAQKLGIIHGKPDGSFGVNDTITRQDMAVMTYQTAKALQAELGRGTNTAAFTDQSTISGYAQEAVAAMHAAGIINGVNASTFAPKAQSTRAEAAVIIYRLFQLMK